MKTHTTAIAAALVLVTMTACKQQGAAPAANEAGPVTTAGEILAGTWKADLASLKFEGKPDEFRIQDGSYNCSTCIPPLTVAADGAFHPVADRPYFDSMSVKVVDPRTVEVVRRKADKMVSSATLSVSEDGNVLTTKFVDATTPNSPPVEGSSTAKRAGPAPAGAHAISGQWTPDRIAEYSEDALNIRYAFDGDTVTSTSQGQTWVAKIGGPAVPIDGDTGGTTVAVAREGASGLRETYTRGGKQVGIVTVVPNADGKSFTFTNTDPRDGSKSSWTGTKTG